MVRTGKPCSMGSGRPFMATASMASRSSVSTSTGVAHVHPSWEVCSTQSAPASTPTSASRSARRTPLQRALPTSPPPTSLLTQLRVIHDSVTWRDTSSE